MKNITWAGGSDARLLDADDLAKAGVDVTKAKVQSFMFPRGQAIQVTNDVAEAILGHADIFGPFVEAGEKGEELDFSAIEDTDPEPDDESTDQVD